MKIQRISTFNPNFNAKFIQNEDLQAVTEQEVSENRADAWEKGLQKLDKVKRNIRLSLDTNEDGKHVITNLNNGNTAELSPLNNHSKSLLELSNPLSQSYYNLFLANKNINPVKETKRIANIYYETAYNVNPFKEANGSID